MKNDIEMSETNRTLVSALPPCPNCGSSPWIANDNCTQIVCDRRSCVTRHPEISAFGPTRTDTIEAWKNLTDTWEEEYGDNDHCVDCKHTDESQCDGTCGCCCSHCPDCEHFSSDDCSTSCDVCEGECCDEEDCECDHSCCGCCCT